MKSKKLMSIVLSALVAAAVVPMAACGDAATEADVESAVVSENAGSEVAAEGDMVSDETFASLQDNYAAMVDAYNAVTDLYKQDEIAADSTIEDALNQAADVITQMGEITQDTITEADAAELNDAILLILDALSDVVDGMEVTDGSSEAEADSTEGEMVSDETFATLQDNYATLVESYNMVKEYYESDDVKADDDITDTLNQAADLINEMGEISQDTLTEADAVELNDSMVAVMEALTIIVDAME